VVSCRVVLRYTNCPVLYQDNRRYPYLFVPYESDSPSGGSNQSLMWRFAGLVIRWLSRLPLAPIRLFTRRYSSLRGERSNIQYTTSREVLDVATTRSYIFNHEIGLSCRPRYTIQVAISIVLEYQLEGGESLPYPIITPVPSGEGLAAVRGTVQAWFPVRL